MFILILAYPISRLSFNLRRNSNILRTIQAHSDPWIERSFQHNTTTTIILRPFVWDYPGELVHQKKHSPTHTYPAHQPSYISFVPLPQFIASKQYFTLCHPFKIESVSTLSETGWYNTPVSYTHLTLPTNREV